MSRAYSLKLKWGPIRRAGEWEVPAPSGRVYQLKASLNGISLRLRCNGLWGAYILMPPHECPNSGGRRCRCGVDQGGIVITVHDGRIEGGVRWEGRWFITCSAHGTRAYYHNRTKAEAACRDASFCKECAFLVMLAGPCPYCPRLRRGCAMCLKDGQTLPGRGIYGGDPTNRKLDGRWAEWYSPPPDSP